MPEVFALGPLLIPTLKLGLVLLLMMAVWLATRQAQRLGLDVPWTGSTAEWMVWLGLLGARFGFVILNWRAYQDAPWTALYIWQPGYLPLAGVLVGGSYAWWRLQQKPLRDRWSHLKVLGSGFAVSSLIFAGLSLATKLPLDSRALRVGTTVPNITLQTLTGEKATLAELAGRALVLNFWATWCPPCRREMPLLDAVNREYGPRGVTIIGINVNEPASAVSRYIESISVSYPIWVDASVDQPGFDRTQELFTRFGGVGLPTTIFVDTRGVIRAVQVGELNRAFLENRIRTLLPKD